MKSVIIDKIKNIAVKGVQSEAETLYVLAQIRKYFDSTELTAEKFERFPTLALVTDWVLHSKLDRGPAQRKLNQLANNFRSHKQKEGPKFMIGGFFCFLI